MTLYALLQILVYLVVIALLARPLGEYMARAGRRKPAAGAG